MSSSVPAGTSRDFVFQAVPTNSGYATNSAVAYIKNTQIDTTLNTADNAPALEVVRALIEPTAANVAPICQKSVHTRTVGQSSI